MIARDIVLDLFENTLQKQAWQAQPSLAEALEGLTARQAAWKPSPERHSIWQIVRHLIRWEPGILQAWDGDPPDKAELQRGDWPEVSGDQYAWETDVQTLVALYAEFVTRVKAASNEELSRSILWYRDGVSIQPLAIRLARRTVHYMYHVGQIRYLRALQGA